MSRPPTLRVVALGGGTGLPVVLAGLKDALCPGGWPVRGRGPLTAIVTVADDGGSSGRLRQAYRVLAPGDARNCLLALSQGAEDMARLFQFRFDGDDGVGGHSLGNLILTALTQVEGDLARASTRAGEMLGACGRVLVATREDVCLVAEYEDGSQVVGESRIASARRRIRRVRLEPESAAAPPEALEALAAADLIVLGPGSLYTSVIPALLAKGIAAAIAASRARVVFVMNVMTEPGETDGYTAEDHVRALRLHLPELPIHDVLLNRTSVDAERMRRYVGEGASPVAVEVEALREMGCRVLQRDLLAEGVKVRHDSRKLASALLEAREERGRRFARSGLAAVAAG